MNYSYSKENGGLKVYLMDDGRKVSDFEFSKEECEELYANLCEVLFDNLLEKNKDVLYRLKNNIPPPKMVSLNKVCEWIEDNVDERYIRFTLDGCRDPEIEYYRIIEDLKGAMEE